jgi:Uma2 family endonuclease
MDGYRVRSTPGPTTIADLEQLTDEYRYDLVRGWLVREPLAGGEHGDIAMELAGALWTHVKRNRLGRVFAAETGFILAEDPPTVRGPDVAFVATERLPPGRWPKGYVRLAPDLAAEVVSPANRWTDVAAKVRDYFEAGTRLVWIVDPPRSAVTVHRPGRSPEVLGEDDFLSGDEIVPGFQVKVSDLFRS